MDGKTHKKIGRISGAAVAVVCSDDGDTLGDLVLQGVGGCLGGTVGQAIPDLLEPALHSHHRDLAHSFAAGVAVVELTRRVIAVWNTYCRANAAAAQRKACPELSPSERFACGAEAAFWKVAIGFGPGLAAGYVSHLALDASTPRGIPLFVRGL